MPPCIILVMCGGGYDRFIVYYTCTNASVTHADSTHPCKMYTQGVSSEWFVSVTVVDVFCADRRGAETP